MTQAPSGTLMLTGPHLMPAVGRALSGQEPSLTERAVVMTDDIRRYAYTVHAEVQQTMSDLVGIIRREEEIKTALTRLEELRERAGKVSAPGGSAYNPGWHLALDLRNILLIAECVALAPLERQESRGGHTRDDYPAMSPEWRKINLVCSLDGGGRVVVCRQPIPPIRPDCWPCSTWPS